MGQFRRFKYVSSTILILNGNNVIQIYHIKINYELSAIVVLKHHSQVNFRPSEKIYELGKNWRNAILSVINIHNINSFNLRESRRKWSVRLEVSTSAAALHERYVDRQTWNRSLLQSESLELR
jgi:hypothetical protein